MKRFIIAGTFFLNSLIIGATSTTSIAATCKIVLGSVNQLRAVVMGQMGILRGEVSLDIKSRTLIFTPTEAIELASTIFTPVHIATIPSNFSINDQTKLLAVPASSAMSEWNVILISNGRRVLSVTLNSEPKISFVGGSPPQQSVSSQLSTTLTQLYDVSAFSSPIAHWTTIESLDSPGKPAVVVFYRNHTFEVLKFEVGPNIHPDENPIRISRVTPSPIQFPDNSQILQAKDVSVVSSMIGRLSHATNFLNLRLIGAPTIANEISTQHVEFTWINP